MEMEDLVSSHFMPVESELSRNGGKQATIRRDLPLPSVPCPLPLALCPLPGPFLPFHLQCLLTTSSDPDALHSCADSQSSP